MNKISPEAAKLLNERFGCDTVISLATESGHVPYVRRVNAYYEDGCFYIVTHAGSNKMAHLAKNPSAAVAADWFTAQGYVRNLGAFSSEANRELADRLRAVFAEWIDNVHSALSDVNTVILQIKLTSGLMFWHGKRYELDFT